MRRALLIGINYRGTKSELRGCINDIKDIRKYLLKQGYKKEEITILTDDTETKPTRKNIIQAILELMLSGAERMYLHYSGHGSWVPDQNGDEVDGRDECIVPLDHKEAGLIIDDQLRGLLTFMNPKSKLTAVLDSCFSGTGLDLPYYLQESLRLREGNKPKRLLGMRRDHHYPKTPGQVILISGCLDNQTSADAYEELIYQGALTFCLLKTLKNDHPQNWFQFITKLRSRLKKHHFTQIANLTSGQRLSLHSEVDFC